MNRHSSGLFVGLVCLSLAACAGEVKTASAAHVAPVTLNDAQFQALQKYDYPQSRVALMGIADAIDKADPEQYRAYETRLLAVLQTPGTTVAAKDFISRMLVRVGSNKCVPAMVALLPDEKTSLSGLRVLAALPAESAAAALRHALSQTRGNLQIGVIAAIGQRRDAKAVDILRTAALDTDLAAARAAIVTLGHIGDGNAMHALDAIGSKAAPALAVTIDEARLDCAQELIVAGKESRALAIYNSLADSPNPNICAAAYCGFLSLQDSDKAASVINVVLASQSAPRRQAALSIANDFSQTKLRGALIHKLPNMLPTAQLALLDILKDHREDNLRPALVKLMDSPDTQIRVAALEGLAQFGQPEDVALLVKLAAQKDDPNHDTASRIITQMTFPGVGEALAASANSGAAPQRIVAIHLITARGDAAAMPGLTVVVRTAEKSVVLEAARALDRLGTLTELPALMVVLHSGIDPAVAAAVENAAKQICIRTTDKPACEKQILPTLYSSPAIRVGILGILPSIGTPNSLTAERSALADGDPAIHDAAVRALCDWPTIDAAPDLLQIAKISTSVPQQVLALRGYIRLAGTAGNLTDAQRVAMLHDAWPLCRRADEKKLVLSALGAIPSIDALDIAQDAIKDQELTAEATLTTINIAKLLTTDQPDRAVAAFQAVEALPGLSPDLHKQLEDAKHAAKVVGGYIGRWLMAGPYEEAGKDGQALFDIPLGPENSAAKIAWQPVVIGATADWPWAVDLRKLMDRDNAVAYLKVNIVSQKAQSALLLLGSDDGVKAWLNGSVVDAQNVIRPVTEDSDKVTITLKPGSNLLLLKVVQGTGQWGACAKLTAPDGQKLQGVSTNVDLP